MKRVISVLLTLVLCLSLCACGKSKAVSSAESLIDAIGKVTVDSETAVVQAEEAYNALSDKEKETVKNYSVLADARTALNETLKIEQFRQFLLGEWVDVTSQENKISFEENGKFSLVEFTSTYEIDEDTCYVYILGKEITFVVEEDAEGINHLKSEELDADYVRPEDWEHCQPTPVEITTENWQDYFEVREITALEKNAFGECTGIRVSYGIFLKGEYLGKFAGGRFDAYQSKTAFEVECDQSFNEYTINLETAEFTIGKALSVGLDENFTDVIEAQDRTREYDLIDVEYVQNSIMGNYVAIFGEVLIGEDEYYINGMRGIIYYSNPNILRATGTIYLNP